jgi:5-methylcytosine-specific restriction endonuclease McrA
VTAEHHGRKGRPWRRIRQEVLKRDPLCTIRGPKCKGYSTTVDHIVPLTVDPSRAHDLTNLRGACFSCNSAGGARITNARRNGYAVVASAPRVCAWVPGRSPCLAQCRQIPLPPGCGRYSELEW